MNSEINEEFFNECADNVARKLLGCYLFRRGEDGQIGGQIIETEAYCECDPAAHCYNHKIGSKNKKTMHDAMYGAAGTIYIFPNSKYCCLNFVCGGENFGSGVLIRSIMPTCGLSEMRKRRPTAKNDRDLCNGPMKLCLALNITHDLNNKPFAEFLVSFDLLKGTDNPGVEIQYGRRVNVSTAADWLRGYVLASESAANFLSPGAIKITREFGRQKYKVKMRSEKFCVEECKCATLIDASNINEMRYP